MTPGVTRLVCSPEPELSVSIRCSSDPLTGVVLGPWSGCPLKTFQVDPVLGLTYGLGPTVFNNRNWTGLCYFLLGYRLT